MNIPIEDTSFENFPIEFKEINPEDFKFIFMLNGERVLRTENAFIIENNSEKIIIFPNELGYINEPIQSNISLDHKNTVVINAAVGQGKSYSIIQTLKRYYDAEQEYLIFVASPFVSLVKQYCDDIEEAGIPSEHIYSYDNLGRNDTNYINRPIQVITANTLLGNPGEDGFKNSDIKREYLNNLVAHCESNDIKVVFIYDEIHDSYHNFKQEYIFNLWKWKNVILKNYVLSATYNEASKIVIEYLAELTDFRIQIIESERKRFPEKQSELYLHYASSYHFTSSTLEINSLIKKLILKDKKIDILCYSKTLAKSIINPKDEIGKLLIETFGEIKDCTSELPSNQREENEAPQNQYDNTKCNVGTNFKTGVSIEKDNHAYVIILPSRSTMLPFKNMFGIFSGGINSVIQALARQRNKGEIHVILPKPDKFNFSSLSHSVMDELQRNEFEKFYSLVHHYEEPDKLVKYIKLNRQDYFLRYFYENKLKANIRNQENQVSDLFRIGLPKLSYPTYEEFKLERGEEYLASEFPIFGEDISAYITYAALANQFINCKLTEISFKPIIVFKEGEIQSMLSMVYEMLFDFDHLDSLGGFINFNQFYNEIRNSLFYDFQLRYQKIGETKHKNLIQGTSQAKNFEVQLLLFVQKLKNYSLHQIGSDEDYTRGNYFLDCITHSIGTNIEEILEESYKKRVEFYQLLNHFRSKLINSLREYQRGSNHYYYTPSNYYNSFFNEDDKSKFRQLLSLLKHDKFLDNKIFEFKRRFEDNTTSSGKLKTFYSILIEDFLLVEERERDPSITCFGSRRNVKVISAIKMMPNKANIINLVESQNYINLDRIIDNDIDNLT